MRIDVVTENDLDELLPLMRGYCDFYEASPADESLLAMSRALIADPEREGVQLIARDDDGRAVGFDDLLVVPSTCNGRPPRTTSAPRPSTSGSAASAKSGWITRFRPATGVSVLRCQPRTSTAPRSTADRR